MSHSGNNQTGNNLEELCRQASNEMDSQKLNLLVEEIDQLLDEQHKARNARKVA